MLLLLLLLLSSFKGSFTAQQHGGRRGEAAAKVAKTWFLEFQQEQRSSISA